MTDDPSDDDGNDSGRMRDVAEAAKSFLSMQKATALLRAGTKGLDAAFDAVRYALEANEERTVGVLKNHEDPLDTLVALAKIIRDGDVDD